MNYFIASSCQRHDSTPRLSALSKNTSRLRSAKSKPSGPRISNGNFSARTQCLADLRKSKEYQSQQYFPSRQDVIPHGMSGLKFLDSSQTPGIVSLTAYLWN
jgi:hypothetical protein